MPDAASLPAYVKVALDLLWLRLFHATEVYIQETFAGNNLTLTAITHCVGGILKASSININTDLFLYKRAVRDYRELKQLYVVGTIPDLGVQELSIAGRRFDNDKLPLFVSALFLQPPMEDPLQLTII